MDTMSGLEDILIEAIEGENYINKELMRNQILQKVTVTLVENAGEMKPRKKI